jgi:hypothetical protein
MYSLFNDNTHYKKAFMCQLFLQKMEDQCYLTSFASFFIWIKSSSRNNRHPRLSRGKLCGREPFFNHLLKVDLLIPAARQTSIIV